MKRWNKLIVLAAIVGCFLFSACGAAKTKIYVNRQYHDLMIAQRYPKERCDCGWERDLLLFRNYEIAGTDSILVMRYDSASRRFDFIPGVSPGEGYERFEDMRVIRYEDGSFFAVRARNSGNANGNAVYMYYIDERDGSLHPVEVVRAMPLYSETLTEEFFVWDDETITYDDDSVTSLFYVWRQADIHAVPTGGRVSVVYDLEQTGERNYRLFPKETNFAEGIFENYR